MFEVEWIIYRGVAIRKGDESYYDSLIDSLEETKSEYEKYIELAKQAKEKVASCEKQIGNLTRDLR